MQARCFETEHTGGEPIRHSTDNSPRAPVGDITFCRDSVKVSITCQPRMEPRRFEAIDSSRAYRLILIRFSFGFVCLAWFLLIGFFSFDFLFSWPEYMPRAHTISSQELQAAFDVKFAVWYWIVKMPPDQKAPALAASQQD